MVFQFMKKFYGFSTDHFFYLRELKSSNFGFLTEYNFFIQIVIAQTELEMQGARQGI